MLVGLVLAAACHEKGPPRPSRLTDADAGAALVAAPASARPETERGARPPPPPPLRVGCRAVTVEGDVRAATGLDAGAGPLLVDAELPATEWITLGEGARLVAKDPRTTRETIFRGKARILACVDHTEQSLLDSGTFESTAGSGESPGAEEWVVTPHAVVRYASAKMRIAVEPDRTAVTMGGGVAFVWTADDAHATTHGADASTFAPDASVQEGWLRLETGSAEIRRIRDVPRTDAARAAAKSCDEAAGRSQKLTQGLLGGADGGRVTASTIADQVTARRLARATCAVALERARALQPSEARAGLIEALRNADARWSAVPVPR